MRTAALVIASLAACSVEKMPPIVMVRRGEAVTVRRVAILPAECAKTACQGLEAIVAAELAFHGYDVVDLDRIAAIERQRLEIQISDQGEVDGQRYAGASRSVSVTGPMLSDADVWSPRDALAELGVDGLVRVRAAEIPGYPARSLALVRVTRAADAALAWAAVCEIELSMLQIGEQRAERPVRCALAGALR